MMSNSNYYTINSSLGLQFRQVLRHHLEDSSFGATFMGRLSYIALALQMEVLIRIDMFYKIPGHECEGHSSNGTGITMAERAVMEVLEPIYNADQNLEAWRIEFSFSDFRPRVALTGSLEDLISAFRFIRDCS